MAKVLEARAVWQDGLTFTGEATSGHTITMDGNLDAGGHDLGMRPIELLLVSLAGCTAMDVISILRKKRQQVTGYEVRVRGERSDEHPMVYQDIEVEHVVRGENIDPAAVARAVELSETKYCSVSNMLVKAANIRVSYRVEAPTKVT